MTINSIIGSLLTWLWGRASWLWTMRTRRSTFIGIAILILFCFWTASKLFPHARRKPWEHSPPSKEHEDKCLQKVLSKWSDGVACKDVVIRHNPQKSTESPYLPFVGNGQISLSIDSSSRHIVHIAVSPAGSLVKLSYSPIITSEIKELSPPKEATVIDFKEGTIYQIYSYARGRGCLAVQSSVYAHRRWPSVLVQEVTITNNIPITTQVKFHQAETKSWKGSQSSTESFGKEHYTLLHGSVPHVDPSQPDVTVAIAMTNFPSLTSVPPQRTKVLRQVNVIHASSGPEITMPVPTNTDRHLQEASKKTLQEVLQESPNDLRASHVHVWRELWRTGLFVDPEHDPDTPSGLEVNATMYYVVSSFPAPMFGVGATEEVKQNMEKLLHVPDHCFGGPPTMHSASLWPVPKTQAAVAKVARDWKRVLEQNGCTSLVKAGASGIMQAITLSFGGFQFMSGYLEFAANPASMHTSISFRNIHLYKETHINVSVVVNENTGHAEKMVVRADGTVKTPLYACEAGCQFDPVELGTPPIIFPIRMTRPVTPLLYVSHNQSQLLSIRSHGFIRIAHEESLKHHHPARQGTLPVTFWIALVFLIVGFHLYLAKLIYTECFKDNARSKVFLS